jgi:opacity protein-like surface antigen
MFVKAGSAAASGTLLLALASVPALADGPSGGSPWYGSLFAGAAWPSDYEPGLDEGVAFVVGGAVGFKFGDNLRGELEISNIGDSADCVGKCLVNSIDVDVLSFLGNAWLDLPIDGTITPYVGAGVGYAEISLDAGAFGEVSDWDFVYQAGAGFRVEIAQNTMLDFGYRFRVLDDADYDAHIGQIGLTFGL